MKKSFITILIAIILIVCLSSCQKQTNLIVLPKTDEITSIEIANGIEDIICTDKEIIKSFTQKVSEASRTSKKSVQDVPAVSEYTRVDLICDGSISSLFVYQQDSKWYIEQPYRGIYQTDGVILDLLKTA